MTELPIDESLLTDRFAPLRTDEPGDWLAVERRARRGRRRRTALILAAAVAAIIVASPASGIPNHVIDLIWSPSATPEVQESFTANNAMRKKLFAAAEEAGATLHDRFSPVLADKARGILAVDTADGPLYLWAAPTADGRECWMVQAGADVATGRPRGLQSCDSADEAAPMRPESWWTAERPTVTILNIRAYDTSITHVEVETVNATPTTLPVVAGYALGTIAKGDRPTAFIGRNADGDEVARVEVPSGR